MIKLYLPLHDATLNLKKQFLRTGLLLFLMLYIGSATKAQCDVNPVASQTVCNNTATTAIQFTGTATSYNWTNNTPSIGLAASGSGNIAAFNALNSLTTAITATITVTPVSAACTGTPISFTITVNPSPLIQVTPTTSCGGVPGMGCNPLTAGGNADSYIWSPMAGLYTNCTATIPYPGSNTAVVYASPTVSTRYTVTGAIAATGCTGTATALVNNTPPAPIIIPPSVNMCLGDPAVKLRVAAGTGTTQFCSGTVNIAVPDNNPSGAFSSINVSGITPACIINSVTVIINIPHTRIGDMVFVLKAPNGSVLNLDYHLSATGGNGPSSGFVNTSISSDAVTVLSAGTNPYTGTFRADAQAVPSGGFGASGPTGMLQTVSNWTALIPATAQANGNWTLGFYDGVTGNAGTLSSWCLVFNHSCQTVPATPAVWSPITGLFADPAAVIAYTGNAVDSVWVRPTPAGVYTYQVTTQGQGFPLCTPATNFTANNGNSTVTFNVRNNHPYPIRLSQIDSKALTAGTTFVTAYYKTSPVAGPPGAISAANGWNQFASAVINATGTGIQSFMSNLQLNIPAGITYGICVQALTSTNAANLAYSALPAGNYPFNDGGCELITGSNIGYSGNNVPAAPTTALSGFVGALHFTDGSPTCTSPPRSVVVTVGQPVSITLQPVNKMVCAGNTAIYTVSVTGAANNYQWQQSTDGGSSYTNITDGAVFNGTLTNTLYVTMPTPGMNGNLFRVVINAGSGCSGATSNAALLTINPLPNIVIVANPLIIGPTQTTTIFSTVTPNAAATYTWYYNNLVLPGEVLPDLVVNYGTPGDYLLKVTDINGCTNLSNIITIANSFALNLYTYPNPSAGLFQLRYFSETNTTEQRSLVVYNNRGERVVTRNFTQIIPYQKIDVDIRANGKGLYWVELRDANGKRLALNRVVVQ